MRSLVLAAGVVAGLALGACRSDSGERHARTTALAACADAIEAAGSAAAGEQVEVVAHGCSAPCTGLADWLSSRATARLRPGVTRAEDAPRALDALLDGCHARCAVRADTVLAQRWPALIEACGPEELGLPRDLPGVASEEWLVLAEIARWIDGAIAAGVDDGQVPARVEHVTEAASFTLPLPLQPGLPSTRWVAAPRARQFVALVRDEVRIGALPVVRMRGGHVEVAAVPGGYPGQVAEPDRIRAVYAQHADLLGIDPATPPPPLILADAHTPVGRVLDAIAHLEVRTAELAVASDVTLAHPILLERRVSQFATPVVHIQPGGVLIRGFGDDRTADWDHLDDELDHFTAVNAPVRSLELLADPTASLADLARILDACVAARVSTLIFAPPPP